MILFTNIYFKAEIKVNRKDSSKFFSIGFFSFLCAFLRLFVKY